MSYNPKIDRDRTRKLGTFARYALVVMIALMGAFSMVSITTNGASQAVQAAPQMPPLPTNTAIPKKGAVPDTSNLQYGMVMALLGNNSAVRNMGFGWVEYGVFWSQEEANPGDYSWLHGANNVDNIADGARNANVNVLIRISRSPTWARDPACAGSDTCPPANAADFGRFAGAMAARVRSHLNGQQVAYEIWNEPNTSAEWGDLCPDPARYTDLLRAAYPQIKSADPSATVAGGAITTVAEVRNECHVDDLTFLQGMYNAGAAPYFDVLADHPYGFIQAPEADPLTSQSGLLFRRAERHHDYMIANGDGNKRIWATEMGWAIDPHTEGAPCQPQQWYQVFNQQQHADYLVRAFQWARSYWPWMGTMFVWNFDFNEAPWYAQCDSFRYFSVKGRLAQSALQNFVGNPPPTYTPVVVTPPPAPTATSMPTATPTPGIDGPPLIGAVRYSALNFNRNGGVLTLEIDASDNDNTAVDSANAILTNPNGSTQLFVLQLVAGTNRAGTWRATISIAPNAGAGPVSYTVAPYVVEDFPPRRTTNAPNQQIMVANTRFWDVPTDYWAYSYIEYLAAHGAINGYDDGSFLPGNNATRSQLCKIVVLAFGFPLQNPPTAHFADVPVGSAFYQYVETATSRGVINGYPCGQDPSEPCDPQQRPYFRPGSSVTRGQISKIIVLAAAWPLQNPPDNTFEDVAPGSPFYQYVQTAYSHAILVGYPCGQDLSEPCDPQQRPYFRPGANATRAQISKIVYLASTAPPVPSTTPTSTPTATAQPALTPSATATHLTPTATATVTVQPTSTAPVGKPQK